MLHLVTGHKGTAHIKSENIKDFNRDATAYSSFTSGTFTISSGEDTSKLKVNSGFGYVEGRMFEIERGTTEEITFNLANSGYHRIDKVVARYLEEDGVESVYLFVVQGVEVLESVEIEPSEQTPEECVIFYAEITSSRADLYGYGRVSIVEENGTCTSEKSFSHSEGDSTNALGECSHSEGCYSTANGYAAHAGGYYCSARGDQSFAHGENSLARGYNSVAIGRELIADDGQTVFGNMNKTDDSSIFIIGNGNEDFDEPRRNAVEVKADGSFVNEGLSAAADLYNPQTMQPVNPSDFSYVYYGPGTPADAGYNAEATYGKSFLNASTGDQFIVRRQDTGHGYTYSFQKTMTNKKASELAPMVKQINNDLDNLAFGENSGTSNLFDKNKVSKKKAYNVSGQVISIDNIAIATIPVSHSTSYVISGQKNFSSGVCNVWLDSSLNYISTINVKNTTNNTVAISPDNASFIGLSIGIYEDDQYNELNTLQVEKGSSASSYKEYVMSNKQLTNVNASLDEQGLLNKSDGIIRLGYYNQLGEFIQSSGAVTTVNPVNCQGKKNITTVLSSTELVYFFFFNNSTYISNVSSTTDEFTTDVPNNANLAYVCVVKDNITVSNAPKINIFTDNEIYNVKEKLDCYHKINHTETYNDNEVDIHFDFDDNSSGIILASGILTNTATFFSIIINFATIYGGTMEISKGGANLNSISFNCSNKTLKIACTGGAIPTGVEECNFVFIGNMYK